MMEAAADGEGDGVFKDVARDPEEAPVWPTDPEEPRDPLWWTFLRVFIDRGDFRPLCWLEKVTTSLCI